MDNPTEASFDFSAEQITDAVRTWANFNGFSGETCGKCKRTANVLAGGSGWTCVCGHFNVQNWHNHRLPHTTPNLGPGDATIREGIRLGREPAPKTQ